MSATRFNVECDLARYALAFPAGAFDAWEFGEVFQGHVTTDILAASLAAVVVYGAKPRDEQTSGTLIRLATVALRDADAWTTAWHDELDWYAAVWGPREVAWAVNEGFAGFGGFDSRLWQDALKQFFPFVQAEAA